jgi:hypothetical protein
MLHSFPTAAANVRRERSGLTHVSTLVEKLLAMYGIDIHEFDELPRPVAVAPGGNPFLRVPAVQQTIDWQLASGSQA